MSGKAAGSEPARTPSGEGGGRGGRKPSGACPICGKPMQDAYRPFCSQRCADVDLGRWLGERYVIPGPEGGPDGNGSA